MYSDDVNMAMIRDIVMFFLNDKMRSLHPPQWPSFEDFKANETSSETKFMNEISVCCAAFVPESRFTTAFMSQELHAELKASKEVYFAQAKTERQSFARSVLAQWPCLEPDPQYFYPPSSGSSDTLLDVKAAVEAIKPKWLCLYRNWELHQRTMKVQAVLYRHIGHSRRFLPQDPHGQAFELLMSPSSRTNLTPQSVNLIQKQGPPQDAQSVDPAVFLEGIGWKKETNIS